MQKYQFIPESDFFLCLRYFKVKIETNWRTYCWTSTINCFISPQITDTPFRGLREWDAHLNRLAALNDIFPYRRPSYYYPKPPIRPYYLPRSWTPLRSLPSERATVFNHLGEFIPIVHGTFTRRCPLSTSYYLRSIWAPPCLSPLAISLYSSHPIELDTPYQHLKMLESYWTVKCRGI